MATLRELIIKISANSQSFQSEISRASRMGNDYYRVMQTGGRQAAAASRETQRALAEVTSQINTAKASALGMAGAFAGAFATGHLISLADEWSSVNARLKQASQSSDDFTESQRALMDISQRTGTAFSDNASLFARSAASMREYGYSSQQVLDVTEAISTGLKLSGASTAEASSVITQFSQALAQGVLRGEEFNSVNENGDRVIRALAAGMGVARKDLKAMADQGLLTADKFVPALISQLGTMRGEFEAMPQTVSAATTKIENAFMAWVGGANEATGATATLVSVMNGVADNIDTVAAAAGVLASIGGARYLGGKLSDLGSETANLIEARKNEIALAAARAESATQSQRKAAADALAAERAYQLAQSELAMAKNTNAEALATQNAIAKRQAMIAANAALVQSNRAVATSQEALNKMTSAMNLVKAGASGLLSLVGGIPGILMLGAGAWYAMYQKQEQARESAIQYASTLDEVVEKSKQMSPAQIKGAIADAGDSIDALKRKLNDLRDQQDSASASIKQYTDLAKQFGVENDTNNGYVINAIKYQREYDKISRDIAETTSRLNQTISNQNKLQGEAINKTVEMAGAVGSLTEMYDRLNKVTKQSTPVSPPKYAGPVLPELDTKQQQAMVKAERKAVLDGLQGLEKVRQQATYEADDLNLPAGQYEKYINLAVEGERKLQQLRDNNKKTRGKSDAEKTVDTYDKLIKQQKEQIALAGQNTELAKLKYQVSQGELATLTASQKQTLLQNAALIDQQKIREQLAAYEANLADSNASARAYNQAELIGYGQGSRMRERMQEMLRIREEFQQKNVDLQRQYQSGDISEDLYRQELELNKRYLDERLRDQEAYYLASDAQRSDWTTGMREGFANWADTASDYASQSADLVNNAMSGLVGNISDALAGNKVDWEDWASSVLQSMQKIILNAMLVDSLRSASNSGFFSSIGGMFGAGAGAASGSTPSGAYNSAASGIKLNAKGGAYASESLSAYSNSIVSTPTYFAFAKGAGLMGEAGPEAIMPLTRSADGSLGVRMVGTPGATSGGGDTIIHQHFNISGNGDAALKQAMQEAARQGANDGAKQARQDLLQDFSNRGQARRLLGV
ncbi:TPA_asm: phage tail tape measure protein [Salmonella enterica subsp. enterica serovar Agona]|uniref:Phage tail tape measure protein n=1 Tax=Salmonella enterica subsp. enterica serovar Agona TaxID=58095 RepID=A0A6Y1PZB0_SALET|nr:phage tail tape measure protein [Salmonella enterica]EHA4495041.1 phage tail tape measure protein [Salmonella enterica]EHW1979495.1 phage tail tape measure protein [Salmonella enterica subsp. enterica serovar Agona]MDQ7704977.1 phage tail tape measure protein [Salmonella enterica subsp. enterica serovar Agona]HAB1667913.1 phage tail tape measure protein [Salmonella enterica subsp. enterica serovar Agona]HAB3874978.1 phage tail tape measure protein [Salmonella enterica subsp. enterica serova